MEREREGEREREREREGEALLGPRRWPFAVIGVLLVSRKSSSWNEGHEKVRAAGSVPRSRYVRGIDTDESKLNPKDYATPF